MGREQPLSTRNPGRKSLALRCNMLARVPPRLCVEYRNSGAAAPIEHSSVLCPVARPPVSGGRLSEWKCEMKTYVVLRALGWPRSFPPPTAV
jgi:hypothetical protein